MTIVSLSGPAGAAPHQGYLRLAGSAAPFTSHSRAISVVAGVGAADYPDLAAARSYSARDNGKEDLPPGRSRAIPLPLLVPLRSATALDAAPAS